LLGENAGKIFAAAGGLAGEVATLWAAWSYEPASRRRKASSLDKFVELLQPILGD